MKPLPPLPAVSIFNRYEPALEPNADAAGPSYWLVFQNGKLLVQERDASIRIPTADSPEALGIRPIRQLYLGTLEDRPCYCAEVEANASEPEGLSFRALRSLFGALEEDLFHLAGRAAQLLAWDRTHQFCGTCGERTKPSETDRARVCPACGSSSYPRLSPAVITAILKDKQILLAHARHFQGDMHSLIAGFVEPGETLEDCVKREIQEEVGIRVRNIRYFGSQPWPFPNSLMIGFVAEYDSGDIQVDGVEIEKAGWFDADRLPELPSNISIARKIIDWYIQEHTRSLE